MLSANLALHFDGHRGFSLNFKPSAACECLMLPGLTTSQCLTPTRAGMLSVGTDLPILYGLNLLQTLAKARARTALRHPHLLANGGYEPAIRRPIGTDSQSDIVFLRGVANILGMAIERQRVEANLREALEQQQLLIKEVNHRVNNSLQIVASMLHLHSSVSESSEVKHELQQAAGRIAAIARAH
jgi:hypothetical protein